MATIDIDSVTKRYGQREVLHPTSLRLEAGEICGLLGPNGAGKTTLLRILMGLVQASAGRITLFGGLDPSKREVRRRIGYLPQAIALYPALSMRENIHFFGRLYGLSGDELSRRADRLIERVELVRDADKPVAALSTGMARRAMLATTLVHEPDLLILDEPTAGVDPALRVRFWDWFESLARAGTTILVTTHHIAEAARANRVLFLREGRILDDGRPQELMTRHAAADLEAAFVQATQRDETSR